MIEGRRILVTGGAGFIGSHLTEHLWKTNEVTVLDDLSSGKLSNIESFDVEFIEGSITDQEIVRKVVEGKDLVFHLAAMASVQNSVRDPVVSNTINVHGTLNMLVSSMESGVEKLVFASSSAVYGDDPVQPKTEDMAPAPLSPYAIHKLAGEHYCRVFNDLYGLRTTALRFFNVYGPRQNPDSDYAAVIPKFISLLSQGKGITIYGDGEQTRDFIYVKDAVQGLTRAADNESSDGKVINLATGHSITLNELVSQMSRITGNKINPGYEAEREGDIKHSAADITLARTLLGLEPQYSIEDGLREVFENQIG